MNRIVMDQKLNKIQSFNYPPRMIRVTVDEVVGMKNAYGDSVNNKKVNSSEAIFSYWIKDCEIVSLEQALNSSKKFTYVITCYCLSMEYEKFPLSNLDDRLIDAINSGQCRLMFNDSIEGSSWYRDEVKSFVLYLRSNGIDPQMVMVVGQNYNYDYENFPFQYVSWQFNESFYRLKSIEWVDYNDDAKKFLCLNRWPKAERFYFLSQMNKHKILDQFNWSFLKKIESTDDFENWRKAWEYFEWTDSEDEFSKLVPHTYDVKSGAGLYWEFPEHKKDSLLYIVTESEFGGHGPGTGQIELRDVSEKTWRPISIQMPFIIIGQRHSLSRLRDIGYKTFHTIWDESYDMIEDPKERMTAIIDLVLELNSRKDFREMIDSCRDIVDHNYKMMQMRRPENKMISALL
tara:strand:+ start:3957 stop:5162 length:1206 start_codon:yes stop_codon:yes gene_type:complete